MTADRYFREWTEITPIPWWTAGRKQLNEVIRQVNAWTLEGCPKDAAPRLVRVIDMGLQTFAGADGGNGWAEVLREMRDYVQSRVAP